MNVFELAAVLTLDKSNYDDGLSDAEKDAGDFGSKLKNGLGTAAKVGTAAMAAVGTAAVVAGKQFVDNAGQVAEYGDTIDKMSQKMGISAEAYQEWDAILQHSGTSINSMSRGMQTLQKNAVNSADKFEKLGITQEELAKMSTEELFAATISGLQNMGEGAERTALASELLGGSAKELGALLNTSAEDTEAMKKRVHELGGVMSNDAVKASARYQDSLQDMQTALSGLKNNMMAEFLPAFADVMDGLTAIFSGDEGGIQQINDGINSMVTKIAEGIPKVLEVGGQIIGSLAQAILENLPQVVETGSEVILELLKGFMGQLPLVAESAVSIIGTLAQGIGDSLPELIPATIDAVITIVETLIDNADQLIDGALALMVGLAEGLIDAIPVIIEKIPEIITKLITAIVNNVPKLIESGIKLIGGLAKGLIQAIPTLVASIPQIISAIINGLASLPGKMIEIGSNVIKGLWEGISGMFRWITDGIGNFFGGIVDGVKGFLGIHSPSKLFAEIGKFTAEGFGEGFDDMFSDVKKSVNDDFASISDQDINMGTLSYDVAASTKPVTESIENNKTNTLLTALLNKLDNMGSQQIILDTGVLVGQTVSKMDSALGNLASKNARGVLA